MWEGEMSISLGNERRPLMGFLDWILTGFWLGGGADGTALHCTTQLA